MTVRATPRRAVEYVIEPEVCARYLLADLSDEERAFVEGWLLEDDELFEVIVAAEHELIDEYLDGVLSADGLTRFEIHLARSHGLARRVEFSRALRSLVARPGRRRPDTSH
ncbi:MAG TPA: hypothetical protein VLW17_03580 [Thermoanaerobaculaceae bacterium]|nr:hypothetical protein [Thermoanaerobaculaceae bacterium]